MVGFFCGWFLFLVSLFGVLEELLNANPFTVGRLPHCSHCSYALHKPLFPRASRALRYSTLAAAPTTTTTTTTTTRHRFSPPLATVSHHHSPPFLTTLVLQRTQLMRLTSTCSLLPSLLQPLRSVTVRYCS